MDASPPARRVLKRSASTASLASLPTPPRTYKRGTRGRSRGSCDSDSDSDDAHSRNQNHSSDDDSDAVLASGKDKRVIKKRRTRFAQEKDDEEAFWLGGGDEASSTKQGESSKSTTDAKSKGPLLYRKLKASASSSQVEQGLLSPPASRRKPRVAPVAPGPSSPSPATTVSQPVTPQRRSPRKATTVSLSPIRQLVDSPTNPFVVTPDNAKGDDSDNVATLAVAGSDDDEPVFDKPTVTYVFRGVRRVYQNPLFDHAKNRPLSPPPNSKLPVDDPLFSPDPTLKPRLLFPEAHKKRKAKKPVARTKKAKAAHSEDEAGESDLEFPTKIKAPKFEGRLTLDAELRKATKKSAAAASNDDDVFS